MLAVAEESSRVNEVQPLLRIEQVSKRFAKRGGGEIVALQHVTLDIERDQFVSLVGPSGCGKTTLMKLVGGLTPPTDGKIWLGGQQVTRSSRTIGMVFQRAILLPWRSVLDNVLFPIEMLGWPVKKYRDEAMRLIELVGLRGFENARPNELSGGMQQRVSICRALIYDPQMLLMDEPFGALDAMTREDLSMELLRIWTEKKKTIVFVTHSIPEAVLLSDRVVVMTARPGQVVKDIKIDLPRPRSMDTESMPQFSAYVSAIRKLISDKPKDA
jgi:NitT/TauT family transport system ATP-binding protein